MPTPIDEVLYQQAKDFIMSRYKKYSAFASGAIVKKYKELFREKYSDKKSPYADDDKPKNLKRWFEEKWVDVNPLIGVTDDDAYPVFRPTRKVSSKTPTLYQEIPKQNLKEQFKRKQKLRSANKNLPEFEKKGGMIVQSFPNHTDNQF